MAASDRFYCFLFKLILVFSLQIFSREDFMVEEQMKTLIKVTNSKLNVFTHWSVAKTSLKFIILFKLRLVFSPADIQ